MQGRPVMAHAQGAEGIKNAVRAGVRSIEHGIYLDDEAIELMLGHGTWLVPTLIAPVNVVRAADAGVDLPAAVVAKAREVVEVHRDSVRRAYAAGVRIAMGTDSGVGPHGTNLEELALMAACGMTPGDVLEATTSSAARLMGLDGELGRVEPGCARIWSWWPAILTTSRGWRGTSGRSGRTGSGWCEPGHRPCAAFGRGCRPHPAAQAPADARVDSRAGRHHGVRAAAGVLGAEASTSAVTSAPMSSMVFWRCKPGTRIRPWRDRRYQVRTYAAEARDQLCTFPAGCGQVRLRRLGSGGLSWSAGKLGMGTPPREGRGAAWAGQSSGLSNSFNATANFAGFRCGARCAPGISVNGNPSSKAKIFAGW